MGGEKRCGDAGQHQTREDSHGQHILLDPLTPRRLRRAEDDALHAVVDAPACLEGVRVRGVGEVVEICLEQPEGLQQRYYGSRAQVLVEGPHQKRTVDRLLAQVDYKLLQCHGLIVDANEEVA